VGEKAANRKEISESVLLLGLEGMEVDMEGALLLKKTGAPKEEKGYKETKKVGTGKDKKVDAKGKICGLFGTAV